MHKAVGWRAASEAQQDGEQAIPSG
jgi:hypothetical protein